MNGWTILLIFVLAAAAVIIVLYFLGRRAQNRQAEQQQQIAAASQQVSMFIIDKKKLRIKDAGFPAAVTQQVNWFFRLTKVPVLRVKVGPQVMNLMCENTIFDAVPVKKEVKAQVSGIYVTSVRGLHGKLQTVKEEKGGRISRLIRRMQEKAGATPLK